MDVGELIKINNCSLKGTVKKRKDKTQTRREYSPSTLMKDLYSEYVKSGITAYGRGESCSAGTVSIM